MTTNVKRLFTLDEELVVENGTCVAVRPLCSSQWKSSHPLLGRNWLGAVELAQGELIFHEQPKLGLPLLFQDGLRTSEVVGISSESLSVA